MRGLRCKLQKRANCRGRFGTRAEFEHLAEKHQRSNHRGGFEIDRYRAIHFTERSRKPSRKNCRDDAVEKCRASAQSDQREHVRAAIDQRRPETLEEWPAAPQHDRSRKNKFDPVDNSARQRKTQFFAEYSEKKNWHRENQAQPKTLAHRCVFGIDTLFRYHVHRLQRHPALGTSPGTNLNYFGMHWAGVANLLSCD